MTFKRQVIDVKSRRRMHSPVPEGLRVGDWLFCSLLGPTDGPPVTTPDQDGELLFQRIQDLLDEAGATPDNIVQAQVYVLDDADRKVINTQWVKMFPDPSDRPARFILNVDPNGTHWRFAATITGIMGDNLGRMVNSPMIIGKKANGEVPGERLDEVQVMFDNMESWIKSQGGTLENMASIMVYLMEDDRDTLNKIWAKVYPDTSDLPCRQTLIVWPDGIPDAHFGAICTAIL